MKKLFLIIICMLVMIEGFCQSSLNDFKSHKKAQISYTILSDIGKICDYAEYYHYNMSRKQITECYLFFSKNFKGANRAALHDCTAASILLAHGKYSDNILKAQKDILYSCRSLKEDDKINEYLEYIVATYKK